jgi:phenylalanine-4-hydroxylase
MLADPRMARMMEKLGRLGVAAIKHGDCDTMARIYWYSVEFGLSREDGEVRIFGAGLASSFGEYRVALDGDGVERRTFSIEEAAATPYENNHMQPLYFINDGVDALAAAVDAMVD